MKAEYEQLARDILPAGCRPSIVQLREDIAEAIDKCVASALKEQRRNSLSAEVLELETMIRNKEKTLNQKIEAFNNEKAAFKTIVGGHCDLLNAVEAWLEWCEGQGLTEEHKLRWAKVKIAMANYKSL